MSDGYSTDGDQLKRGMEDESLTEVQKMILEILFDAGKDEDDNPVCMTADEIGIELNKRIKRKNHDS